jgi:hypothetical protein
MVMGALGERLDAIRVTATTPDGTLSAELRHRTDLRLSLAAGVYDRCDERWLEARLEQLGRLLWTRRMKAYYEAASDVLEQKVTEEIRIRSPRDKVFRTRRDEVVAEGWSSDGWVCIAVRGMRKWEVRIADGTLDALTEDEFADTIREAAADLIHDQQDKVRELTAEIYG